MFNDEIRYSTKTLQQLFKLHFLTPSYKLSQWLATYREPKDQTLDLFIAGIQRFAQIANLNAEKRIDFFGNKFLGLHYKNDLAELCNENKTKKTEAYQLSCLSPPEWDYTLEEDCYVLTYRGKMPAEALNILLQGPTVIDCGMFCQLSVWFGIRYMLGDTIFNKIFNNKPFYITQHLYQGIEDITKPYSGNPLFSFFTQNLSTVKAVGIVHIPNHKLYQLKHLGGNYGGSNCVFINGTFTIFDPTALKTSDLSEADVEESLLEALNESPDSDDASMLALFKKTPERLHPFFGHTFKELITLSQELKDLQLTASDWKSAKMAEPEEKLWFDFEKFTLWLNQTNEQARRDYITLEDETPSEILAYSIKSDDRAQLSFFQSAPLPADNRTNVGNNQSSVTTIQSFI